jgi:hypothetical protein
VAPGQVETLRRVVERSMHAAPAASRVVALSPVELVHVTGSASTVEALRRGAGQVEALRRGAGQVEALRLHRSCTVEALRVHRACTVEALRVTL